MVSATNDAPAGESPAQSDAPAPVALVAEAEAANSPVLRVRDSRHLRTNSFQRWRRQIQRAWKWGGAGGAGDRERSVRESANLEVMTNQKRLWYRTQSKSRDVRTYRQPTSLFEHFFIVGLHSHANVEVIEDAFAKRKTWESEVANEICDTRKTHYHDRTPTLEPQILFKYPPAKRVAMREYELPAFCFPEGIKARLIERTPSMSDLNEVIFGQEHLSRDDLSFVFFLKGSDNAPLYGVCLHVQEIVQRAPGILGAVSPFAHSTSKPSRFLVSAPRCYCLLTRVPFFELHYEVLNSLVAQERLDRITNYVGAMTLMEPVLNDSILQDEHDETFDSPSGKLCNDWLHCAIPTDSVSGLICSTNLSIEKEVPPSHIKKLDPTSPESPFATEASYFGHLREVDKDLRRVRQQSDDFSETSGSRSDSFERNGFFENGHTSPDVCVNSYSVSSRLHRTESLEYVYSSVREGGSDDEDDDELNTKNEMIAGDEKVMGWAKANNNEPLQIICGYHALHLPVWGTDVIFHPLEHLQPIKYCRPGISSLGLDSSLFEAETSSLVEAAELNLSDEVLAKLAAAEEALALSIWTVAAVCRSLSLENVLALLAGVLLEKQVVIICPNLGLLSAITLSVIPMIRPFQWQSLLLPVLPSKMLDFLDAPVPFIVGIQHKPTDVKLRTANLVRIDVSKNQVKTCSLPQLPRFKELVSNLGPIHARLFCEKSIAKRHPVYRCSEVQAEAAGQFLDVMRQYLESLCSHMRSHTITNVQSSDKVSLLLKDSFVESFPTKDQPFVKLFMDTQLFTVLSDSRMSRYEDEKS